MRSARFTPHARELALALRKLDRPAQKRAFASMLAYVNRESGGTFDCVADFLDARAPRIAADERDRILGALVRALKDGEVEAL